MPKLPGGSSIGRRAASIQQVQDPDSQDTGQESDPGL